MKFLIYISTILIFACSTKQVNNELTEKLKTELTLPFYNDNDYTPKWQDVNHIIKPFELTNQFGDTITEKYLEGKITIANFFFTSCPSICPKMTTNLKRVQDSLKGDDNVLLISHSVTPEKDNIKKLQDYANLKGVRKNWHLLTIDSLSKMNTHIQQSFLIGNDQSFSRTDDEFIHTEKVVLIDVNLKIRGVYNGTIPLETIRILEDINLLRKEFNL